MVEDITEEEYWAEMDRKLEEVQNAGPHGTAIINNQKCVDLILKHYPQKSSRSIGKILGISQSHVRNIYHKYKEE